MRNLHRLVYPYKFLLKHYPAERAMIERLSGVGIFDRPPDWATPPAW